MANETPNPVLWGNFGDNQNYTLRDRIATQVFSAFLDKSSANQERKFRVHDFPYLAKVAYEAADAMLKERIKNG
jgi:hypothetical protein